MTQTAKWKVVSALGVVQIFTWGSTYYLMTVLAQAIETDTGWPFAYVVGALSVGLLAAGLISPLSGRMIDKYSGRSVMTLGCVLLAIGMFAASLSPSLWFFLLSWVVIGTGMAMTLYDPAFSTLAQLYGSEARRSISVVTLWGGFASTLCWPLTALVLEQLGWRGTFCFYALLHLLVSAPILHFVIAKSDHRPQHRQSNTSNVVIKSAEKPELFLLASILVISTMATTIVAVHLISFLQASGYSLAAAVALGALIGPAQVAGRVVEMTIGVKFHPKWTLLSASLLLSAGMLLLALNLDVSGLALVIYGAGNGIFYIARGVMPLHIFGKERYAVIMGRLARPVFIGQALSPMLGAYLISWYGAGWSLWAVFLMILLTFIASLALAYRLTNR